MPRGGARLLYLCSYLNGDCKALLPNLQQPFVLGSLRHVSTSSIADRFAGQTGAVMLSRRTYSVIEDVYRD